MLLVSSGDSAGLEYRESGRNRLLAPPGAEVGESTGGVADTAIVYAKFPPFRTVESSTPLLAPRTVSRLSLGVFHASPVATADSR